MALMNEILVILNSIAFFILIIGIALSVLGISESIRVISFTKIRGEGLPKVALSIFGSIFFLFMATIFSIFVVLGNTVYVGMVYLLLFLSLTLNVYGQRNLRKMVYLLLYS